MRIHLLAPPHVPVTPAYPLDGFVQRTRWFAELCVQLGHTVILYGTDHTDVAGVEFVSLLTPEQVAGHLQGGAYQSLWYDPRNPLFVDFNRKALWDIEARKQPGDWLAMLNGPCYNLVLEKHPELPTIEFSVGYQGVCGRYRVFQSHVWRHAIHGMTNLDGGREFDTVIPPWFPTEDFPQRTPEDYVAFCGRLVPAKGVKTVCDAAEAAGVPLKLIGFGQPELVTYGDHLGPLAGAERNEVLARARAVLMPTQYLEPFGNVAAEAQLCGTPMITTDYGAFVESVEHGVTGFRCHYLGEFVQAIRAADSLDRAAIRRRAQRLYGVPAALEAYRTYFHRLELAEGDGWASLAPSPDPAFAVPVYA